MTKCTTNSLSFPALKKHKIELNFEGGCVSSDGGVLLLRQMDDRIKLTEQVAKIMPDDRDPDRIDHTNLAMLRQRVYGLALGYEDLNDHDKLRHDIGFQTSVNCTKSLASSPTLCRFENRANRKLAIDIHKILVEQFIASFDQPPKELTFDFDATDDLVHGNQVGRFFHGYYGNYCFLPLYVFCGKQLLVGYLRTADKDGADQAWAILSLLARRLRQVWPSVKIIFRGDSGFCRHRMLNWCEKQKDVYYITGLATNKILVKLLNPAMAKVKEQFESLQCKQRAFVDLVYGAKSWGKNRRVIGKAECTEKGENPRFIVTNLPGDAQDLYDNVYCARGDMENRIKEQQLSLFADRTSCHDWWPNQFRLLLAALAYVLIERIRAIALANTELENAQVETIRLKLFKIGAIIVRNTRRIKFILSSHYPYQNIFSVVYRRLVPI